MRCCKSSLVKTSDDILLGEIVVKITTNRFRTIIYIYQIPVYCRETENLYFLIYCFLFTRKLVNNIHSLKSYSYYNLPIVGVFDGEGKEDRVVYFDLRNRHYLNISGTCHMHTTPVMKSIKTSSDT